MTAQRILVGDCRALMAEMAAASVDAVVCDPPYGLGFMGKAWDALPPGDAFACEALRVLKPGGHLLAFGGTRMYHRLVCALEDAGFEIRDALAWMYGTGFPKSLDVSKAIDATLGNVRADRVTNEPGANTVFRPSVTVAAKGTPVATESHIMTDAFKSYAGLGREYASHQVVQHGDREYVRGIAHTNTAEGYFSILKRGVDGVYHHVSKEHLHRYLKEFDFRYNTRHITDGQRTRKALEQGDGRRLRYAETRERSNREAAGDGSGDSAPV